MMQQLDLSRTFRPGRRRILMGAAAGLFAPAIRRAAAADVGTVVVTDGGGSWGEAQKRAYYEPFEKATGIKVRTIPWAAGPKIMAAIQAGVAVGDCVDLAANQLSRFSKAGLLLPVDTSYFDPKDIAALSPAAADRFGIPALFGSMCLSYDSVAMAGHLPQTWADFFDVKNFPGPRTIGSGQNPSLRTFEIALMGDGVPLDKIYPIDFDRCFKALERIRGSIVKFWTAPAEPGQLLVDKNVIMASDYSGRVGDLRAQGVKVDFTWRQSTLGGPEYWVVPKNAQNAENAFKLIAYMTRPDRGAAFASLIDYSPTNTRAYDLLPKERLTAMPTAPQNGKEQLLINVAWWSEEVDGVPREQLASQMWERWVKG
jgi:putative spermidine/putrescine transport system substrate-binding protein